MSTAAQSAPDHSFETCVTLPIDRWAAPIAPSLQAQAATALENGSVLLMPNLPFALTPEEQTYLRPDCVKPKSKSVKYSPRSKRLWGMAEKEGDAPALAAMLQRYADSAQALVTALFPQYAGALTIGNGSFRPVEAAGRVQSKRHDDRLLHVDAFPSRPNRGERILRVFTNIGAQPRVWRVGESFPDAAQYFLPHISKPLPGSARVLKSLGLTKSLRSPYDHYMLKMHDYMKFDDRYQQNVAQTRLELPPGSSWIVYTDQVSHAAMSGCLALEQTFTLPVAAQYYPDTAPLRVLERLKSHNLT